MWEDEKIIRKKRSQFEAPHADPPSRKQRVIDRTEI